MICLPYLSVRKAILSSPSFVPIGDKVGRAREMDYSAKDGRLT